ncbi:hypothetical protein Droror1_Dr00023452 [Drosera rotundifolia]
MSKMARFMAALALAYMFDGGMDEVAVTGISAEGSSMGVNLEGAKRVALKHIEAFVLSFVDPQAFSTAATSSRPAALAQVMEAARINEAGHLRCRCFSFKLDLNLFLLKARTSFPFYYSWNNFFEEYKCLLTKSKMWLSSV